MFELSRREIVGPPEIKRPVFQMAGSTQASERHSQRNEDNFFTDSSKKIFGVFDGMGGEFGGQEASSTCNQKIRQQLQISQFNTFASARSALLNAFNIANQSILKLESRYRVTIGSTGTFGVIYQSDAGSYQAMIAHAGDSRAYLFRHGVLTRLTQDHNNINSKYGRKSKTIQDKFDNITRPDSLSRKEKALFDDRNRIYKYFGHRWAKPEIIVSDIKPDDILLLSTDGIHDNLTTSEISQVLSRNSKRDPLHISQELINQSVFRSRDGSFRSKPDDMTALVIKSDSSVLKAKSTRRFLPNYP